MPSSSAATQLVHIGRQPIYDRDGHVVAYELLFRGDSEETEASRRSLYATSQIIVNAFTEFGLEQIVGSRMCFINLTRDFLTGDLPVPFEPGQAVLEIVETVDVDDAVLAGVSRLVDLGYPVSISSEAAGDGYFELRRLATYIKVDVLERDRERIEATVAELRQFPGVKLIAERAETDAHVELAEWLSFDLFQGHALGRPQVLSIQSLSPSRMRRLELLGALNADDVDLEKVVNIVTGDPGLSFRVLRATNSAATGLPRKVSSVRDAVVMLGLTRIRQWVALMLVSDIAESATDDQLATTMARARLCQIVADRLDLPPDAAFTVGLLAGIAELVSEPISELVSHLPLTREVTDALVRGTGRLGQVLAMVRAYEATDVHALQNALVSSADLAKAYLAAVGWSVRTVDGVLGGGNSPRRMPPPSAFSRGTG